MRKKIVTGKVLLELENLANDNLVLNKNKTKSIATTEEVKSALIEGGIETVQKQRYLGVTIANSDVVMIAEAKKLCEVFTMTMA